MAMAGRIAPLDDDEALAVVFPGAAEISAGSLELKSCWSAGSRRLGLPYRLDDVAEAILERDHQKGGSSAGSCAGGGSRTAAMPGIPASSSVSGGATAPPSDTCAGDRGCAAPQLGERPVLPTGPTQVGQPCSQAQLAITSRVRAQQSRRASRRAAG
jgi:hypothetical protein